MHNIARSNVGPVRIGRSRMLRLSIGIGFVLVAAGCGSEDVAMPDVTTQRLDVALSDIERAGFDDEVEVIGGGAFGVVDESNWVVCEQDPPSGSAVGSAPRLTVDRECDSPDQAAGADEETGRASPQENRRRTPASKPRRDRPRGQSSQTSTFVMPALVGANLQDGQNALQAAGSYLLTQNDALGLGRFQVLDRGWVICGQSPAAGEVAPVETMVDLRVVKLDEACP